MKTILEFLQKKKIEKAITDSGYEGVDLGLSVKWANMNIGAKSIEDAGLLFQFGRTDGYEFNSPLSTSFSLKEGLVKTFKTPPTINEYKKGDTLSPEDDAAHINMKGSWRMPTKEEIDQLLTLNHKYTTKNGIDGWEFTADNGNSVFFPHMGYFSGTSGHFLRPGRGMTGIWGSTIRNNDLRYAYAVVYNDRQIEPRYIERCNGFFMRAVCD